MLKVEIAPLAARDLSRVPERELARVKPRILALERDARPHGVKKLEGPLHRTRVGDWRILYSIDDDRKIVVILRVLRRSERTYKFI